MRRPTPTIVVQNHDSIMGIAEAILLIAGAFLLWPIVAYSFSEAIAKTLFTAPKADTDLAATVIFAAGYSVGWLIVAFRIKNRLT